MDDAALPKQKDSGTSPLDKLIKVPGGSKDAGIFLKECRHSGKLILRGDPSDDLFIKSTSKVLGYKLPLTPNTFLKKSEYTSVWLGPDEWLVNSLPGNESSLERDLNIALTDVHHSVTNVSDNSTIIQLSGPKARSVIMKGCAVDVHPRVFHSGSAFQSNLAAASVIMWQLDLIPTFNIMVRASFASYLWKWLLDASAEFGVQIEQ
jgi:sarcosine oxidase subunit gamma